VAGSADPDKTGNQPHIVLVSDNFTPLAVAITMPGLRRGSDQSVLGVLPPPLLSPPPAHATNITGLLQNSFWTLHAGYGTFSCQVATLPGFTSKLPPEHGILLMVL